MTHSVDVVSIALDASDDEIINIIKKRVFQDIQFMIMMMKILLEFFMLEITY
ncbi:MAG: hypothetical protein ACLRHW_06520 [Coprobacillus cateniformis]